MTMSPQAARELIWSNKRVFEEVHRKYIHAIYILGGPILPAEVKQAVIKQDGIEDEMSQRAAQLRINNAAFAMDEAFWRLRNPDMPTLREGALALEFLKGLEDQLAAVQFFQTRMPDVAHYVLTDELVEAAQVLARG